MLAPTPKGNLGPVWDAMAKRAEATINERADRQGSSDAEVSDSPAQWFLVRTYPGDDAKALRWLARRRFGAFSPMQQRRDKQTGNLVQGFEAAFPGWIFVLAWNIGDMRWRIMSCPGVMNLLCDPVTNRPVPIDDEFIDRVRALSWIYDERAPHARHYSGMRAVRNEARIKPKRQRIPKRTRKTLDKLKNELKAVGKWDVSTWEKANELAPHERIALLQQALNAPAFEGGVVSP